MPARVAGRGRSEGGAGWRGCRVERGWAEHGSRVDRACCTEGTESCFPGRRSVVPGWAGHSSTNR